MKYTLLLWVFAIVFSACGTRNVQTPNEERKARELAEKYVAALRDGSEVTMSGRSPNRPDNIWVNVRDVQKFNWLLVYEPTHSDYKLIRSLYEQNFLTEGHRLPALEYSDELQGSAKEPLGYMNFLRLVD